LEKGFLATRRGRRIREISFLYQSISVLVQHFNAVLLS